MFLVDQYLPVWVQCTVERCRKWRKLPPSIELHHVKQDIVRCNDCQRSEDEVGKWKNKLECGGGGGGGGTFHCPAEE